MTREQLDEEFERASRVALALHKTSDSVRRLIQVGELDGVFVGNAWYVEKQSVIRYLAKQAKSVTAGAA
jgi:hypothetical protein